jgi:hypothetical protein
MPAPSTHYGRDVTGDARFRRGWGGRLVLQVLVEDRPLDTAMGEPTYRWIDAVESDLYPLRYHRKHRGLEPLL